MRGLRGLRGLKGSFGPLEKKDLARQSPEPTVCATPPTVSHRAQSPQSSKCEVWERLKRAEKSKDLESSGSTPSVVPGAAPAFAKAGVGGFNNGIIDTWKSKRQSGNRYRMYRVHEGTLIATCHESSLPFRQLF